MQNLLEQPKPTVIKSINQVLDAIQEAAPIPAAHKKSLPHDIRDLSSLLTEERGSMGRPYWAAKNLFSAYVHYFLPWNLYRLGWLLPSLPLNLAPNSSLMDLGSGPLTLPLALWCAKPELRQIPLHFLCTDVANQPMEQGLAVFNALTKGESPWVIECVKAPIESALIKLSDKVDLIMAGNVLNELQPAKGQTLQERIGGIVHSCSRKLKKGGNLLFVEPGTRLGGKVVIMAREAGRELGLPILAPCTHQERCPLAKDMEWEEAQTRGRVRGSQMASQTNMWCHFSFPVQGAPARLSRLTAAAKFDRRNLALSCLMMTTGEDENFARDIPAPSDLDYLDDLEALYDETMRADQLAGLRSDDEKAAGGRSRAPKPEKKPWEKARYFEGLEAVVDGTITPPLWTRIISGPIRLPKEKLPARYGCAAAGLVLVRRCERIPYGAAVEVTWEKLSRDEKSRALMVDMVLTEGGDFAGSADEDGGMGKRFDKPARGRTNKRPGERSDRRFGDRERQDRSDSQKRHSMERQGRGERDKKSGFEKGRKATSATQQERKQTLDSQSQVSDFQNFFGRPQKMRERYGGLPQNLRQTAEEKNPRQAQGAKDSVGKNSHFSAADTDERPGKSKSRTRRQETEKTFTRGQQKSSHGKNDQDSGQKRGQKNGPLDAGKPAKENPKREPNEGKDVD